MRKYGIKYLLIALLAMTIAGCASGSAPLVDLPAPISGHINISNPDSDGNVLVAGSAGAVDGGSLVLVVNETTTGVSAVMILDMLVKSAHAQSSAYPDICNTDGRACGMAGTDGSFDVTIPAAIGDSLAIGVIDWNGRWISEILRRDIPSTETALCADADVNGAIVDIKVLNTSTSDTVYAMLKQGSADTPNQIVIGTSTTEGEVFDIEGCYAHSLDIQKDSSGSIALVATSKDDKIIWFGVFDGSDIVDKEHFTLSDEPMSVNYASSGNGPIVALKTSSTVILAEISETDGSTVQSMEITDGAGVSITGLTRGLRIGLMEMTGEQFLGLLITDKGSSSNTFMTIFLLDGMREYKTWENGSAPFFGNFDTLSDGTLWSQKDSVVNYIKLAFLGSKADGNFLQTFELWIAAYPLTKETPIDAGSDIHIHYAGAISPRQVFELKKISVAVGRDLPNDRDGIITTSKGNLLAINLIEPDTPSPEEITLDGVATGSDLVAIDILNSEETAYVADGTGEKAILADGVFP